jgi:Carboxypeptidase regulatory-like domain
MQALSRVRKRIALAALLFSLAAITSSAQVVGGTISGLVTDPTGAAIPNVHVLVRNEDTGSQRALATSTSGTFSAPSIPVGSYKVTAQSEGFTPYSREHIALTIGQSLNLPITLTVGAETQVNVSDNALPTVNTSTEQTSGLVDARQVKQLPLNGRSYDQLITLNPATVNTTSQRSGSIGTSNSSVGNMFSVSGRRPQDNLFLLNGVEYTGASLINVTPGGTSGQLLGVEAVREFNVVADTYSAAYGKREGAQISIVTASGTNKLHGSAYEFLRNSFFDARNYFDQSRIPEFQRNNYGIALGGPIRHDKVFLFGNYEGYRQNLGLSDVTFVPDNASRAAAVASVKPLLNLWPVANGPEIGNGIALAYSSPTQHIREDFGTTRFDANLTPNDLFFAVYTIDDSDAHTPTANPLSLIHETLREQVLSAQEQHVFSPHLLNTARFGYSRASFYFLGSIPADIQAETSTFIPGKPTGAIVIAGSTASNGSSQITAAGANVGSNNAITRNLFTLDDHIFYTIGKHQIEAGIWLQRLQSNDNLAQNQYGQASFASLATFLTGNIKTFTVVPQPTELGWRALFADAYLEDAFHITPRLEVRAGLRTESSTGWNESQGRTGVYQFGAISPGGPANVIQTNPTVQSGALTDNRALFLPEPRLGVAWNVFGDGHTSIRASVGLHHSLLDNLDYRLDQAAPFNTTYAYSATTITTPTTGTGSVSPSTVQTDIATPALLSYTLRIEQQIAPSTSITLAYLGSHGYHQILSADLNEPAFTITSTGRIYYPTTTKPNSALANTTSWTSGGSSNYNAFVADFRRDFAHGLQFRANYTWSKNLDDGSAWNTSVSANTPAFVSVPQLPHLDYGPSANDVRHLVAINGTYDLPLLQLLAHGSTTNAFAKHTLGGWSISTIANLQTGFPFSPQLGYNPTGSGDSRNPVRPDLNPNFHSALYNKGTTAQRVAGFFNPNAFSAPAYGTVGNLGRDTLTGPGYADWDLSLLKSTAITESTRLQFRAEFFNVLNHTNLGIPNEVVYSSGPTQGNATAQNTSPVLSPTAGVITSAATSRQIQLSLKLLF